MGEWRRKFVTKIRTGCKQSHFSDVDLLLEVFQDIFHSNKANPSSSLNAILSCPFIASNYANGYLVPISFWMLTIPCNFWGEFEGIFQWYSGSFLSRFTGVYLSLQCFRQECHTSNFPCSLHMSFVMCFWRFGGVFLVSCVCTHFVASLQCEAIGRASYKTARFSWGGPGVGTSVCYSFCLWCWGAIKKALQK